jgi:hypothetical protein
MVRQGTWFTSMVTEQREARGADGMTETTVQNTRLSAVKDLPGSVHALEDLPGPMSERPLPPSGNWS